MTTITLPGSLGDRLAAEGLRPVVRPLYEGLGAQVYDDVVRRDRSEISQLLDVVRRRPGPVLELAAGGGRITLALLAGLREPVTALELSGDMLAILDDRLMRVPASARSRCTLVQGDMRELALGTRFGSVVLGTDSVCLLDTAGRAAMFRGVVEHLGHDGRFVLTTAELRPGTPAPHERVMELPPGTDARRDLFDYVRADGRMRSVSVVCRPRAEGPGDVEVYTSEVRLLPATQLCEEMAAAGLRVEQVTGLPSADVDRAFSLLVAGSAA